jgi:hypothetical protein
MCGSADEEILFPLTKPFYLPSESYAVGIELWGYGSDVISPCPQLPAGGC